MASSAAKSSTAISMRFKSDALSLIDRGAALSGLSRTEFMTRAAVHDAQQEILNARMIALSPESWAAFERAIYGAPEPRSPKLEERLSRRPPWAEA